MRARQTEKILQGENYLMVRNFFVLPEKILVKSDFKLM